MRNIFFLSFFLLFYTLNYSQSQIAEENYLYREKLLNNINKYRKISDSALLSNPENTKAIRIKSFLDIYQFKYLDIQSNLHGAIKIDSTNGNKNGLDHNYILLGRYYKDKNKLDSAIFYYDKAMKNLDFRESFLFGRVCLDLAVVYMNERKLDSAQVLLEKGIESSNIVGDSLTYYELINLNENILNKTTTNEKEVDNLINYLKRQNNQYLKATADHKISNILRTKQDSVDRAIELLDSSITFFENSGNLFELNAVYTSRASIADRSSIPNDSPLKYYEKQEKILRNTGHVFEYMTQYNLGNQYYLNNDYGKAKKMFENIINQNTTLDLPDILISYSNLRLSNIYEDTDNNKLALKYLKNHLSLEEKSYSERITNQINNHKVEYETQKKENENLQLKQEKQEQELKALQANRQRSILGVSLLGALILGGLAFASYKKSNQQKQRIERLQRELHHRMKNNLSIVDVFLETSEREIQDKKVIDTLNELRNRIHSIANVHELLVDNKDVTNLNLHQYINELVKNVKQTIRNDNIQIELNVPENIALESNKSFPVGLIVNEFLTNSFKYAFPNNQKGTITIDIQEKAGMYLLKLKDDGIGLKSDFDIEKTNSFGMRIMLLLAEQLSGSFNLQSTDGIEVSVKFPQ